MGALPSIPGYELQNYLGGGPLTRVFTARHAETGQSFAVKTLRAGLEDEATAIKLMQREARAGLMVQHRNLVKLAEAHVTRPPHFIAMEFLPGPSLRQTLEAKRRLSWPHAVDILRDVCSGLHALHRAGFMHGDIKPENILLVEDGTAKVIDLGFAHRPGENRHFLADGYVLGTVNYLAPEMIDLDAAADCRSDLYSLGVMLYEMLTGALPFPAGGVRETLQSHRSERPALLHLAGFGIPDRVASLLDQLITPAAQDRLPNAMALVQRLAALEFGAAGTRMVA